MSSAPGPIRSLKVWARSRKRKLDGRPVVASISGGKDSTALALLLKEADIPFQAVHMDTGWEHEDTEAYVREYLPGVIGPIGGMEDLILKKGMFPGRLNRFCTEEMKVRPFAEYLGTLKDEPVNAIGIRADESQARSKLTEWETGPKMLDCLVWRPLIRWSEDDVIAMHKRHGIRPNPLYLMGASRVGCWPCIFARKSEIRLISEVDPERIGKIRELERDIQGSARLRYAKRGETFESLGYHPPTYFTLRKKDETGARRHSMAPIDDVVEWSKTSRGGKELELFNPARSEGCMRWGLCETSSPEQERGDAEEG